MNFFMCRVDRSDPAFIKTCAMCRGDIILDVQKNLDQKFDLVAKLEGWEVRTLGTRISLT